MRQGVKAIDVCSARRRRAFREGRLMLHGGSCVTCPVLGCHRSIPPLWPHRRLSTFLWLRRSSARTGTVGVDRGSPPAGALIDLSLLETSGIETGSHLASSVSTCLFSASGVDPTGSAL